MTGAATSRLQVLGAAVLFSSGGAAIKATSLAGLELAGARSAVAAVTLIVLLPSWRRFYRPRILAVGACYAATLTFFVIANKYTLAANAIFLQSTSPIWVLLLAPRLLGEPNRRCYYAITSLLMAGLAFFFVDVDNASTSAPDPAFGNAVAIAAGVALAFGLMGLRWLAREPATEGEDAVGQAVVASNVLAAAVCLPSSLPVASVSAQDALLIVYLGAIQIALAYFILGKGVRGLPAVEVALLLLAEPVLGTLWNWLVFDEAPGPWSLAGCGVILLATSTRVVLQSKAS